MRIAVPITEVFEFVVIESRRAGQAKLRLLVLRVGHDARALLGTIARTIYVFAFRRCRRLAMIFVVMVHGRLEAQFRPEPSQSIIILHPARLINTE